MKPGTQASNDYYKSLIDNIEVQIFGLDGAPYCEFTPSWKLNKDPLSSKEKDSQPCGYIMSDGGYAESYPMYSE